MNYLQLGFNQLTNYYLFWFGIIGNGHCQTDLKKKEQRKSTPDKRENISRPSSAKEFSSEE